MPTVFSAKLDGSHAVRYHHVSLVTFYLRQARSRALAAAALRPGEEQFSETLLAIICAALCLEAFVNEMGENILPAADLKDFLMSRKSFRKPAGIAAVSWKVITLFQRQWGERLEGADALVRGVEELFEIRNALVHYKFGESAAKSYLPPPAQLANPETGQLMTVFDFMQQPTHVEEPLVSRVQPQAAQRAYNAALRVLQKWNERASAPAGALAAHAELPEA
jgi:hypothetical protein